MSLKKAGLSDYESKIYTALLSLGRTGAANISRESKVPPTAVYPNLKSLSAKGFVEIFEGETFLYEAISPEKALDNYAEIKINEIKSGKEEILRELRKISAPKIFDPIRLSYGRETSFNIFQEQALKAKKKVYVAGWKFSRHKDVQATIKVCRKMKENNVDVRMIFISHTEVTDYLSGELKKLGIKAKFLDIGNFSVILFDDDMCKISLKSEDRKERVNVLINDGDLAMSMTQYFESIWKKAKL